MKEIAEPFAVRRILVALNTAARGQASLETAAALAAQLEAELLGLFVEEENLWRLAQLPFAREVRFPSGAEEAPDLERLARELRVQAERTRQTLAAIAERARVRWTFRIVRGETTAQLLAAATAADLLWLCKPASSYAAAAPVLAVCRNADDDLAVVQAAAQLAQLTHNALCVILPPPSKDTFGDAARQQRLQHELHHLAERFGAGLRTVPLTDTSAAGLAQALQQTGAGIVVISQQLAADSEAHRRWLAELNNLVLLVQ